MTVSLQCLLPYGVVGRLKSGKEFCDLEPSVPTQSTSLYHCGITISFLIPTIICPTQTPELAGVSTHTPSRERHVEAFCQEFASMPQKDIPAPVCSHLPRGEYLGKKASVCLKSKCVTLNTSYTFSQLQACSPLAVLLKGCLWY